MVVCVRGGDIFVDICGYGIYVDYWAAWKAEGGMLRHKIFELDAAPRTDVGGDVGAFAAHIDYWTRRGVEGEGVGNGIHHVDGASRRAVSRDGGCFECW